MNALSPAARRLSLRQGALCLGAIVLVSLGACQKKPDGAAPDAGGGAAAPAAKPKTSLTSANFQAAYAATVSDMKLNDPMDKRIANLVAKVGPPAADDGHKKVWYAINGADCMKEEVAVDGSVPGAMTETSTAKTDCGL